MRATFLLASISRNAGGMAPAVRGLAAALDCHGVGLAVCSPEDAFSQDDLPLWLPLLPEVCRTSGPRSFAYARGLLQSIVSTYPDLLHAHGLWMYPSVAASSWHRQSQKPYVVSPHGMLDPWALHNSRWKKRLAGWLYENKHLRNAACIHSLCESEADSIRAYGLKNPICIIPNGMDLPELTTPQPRTENRERETKLKNSSLIAAPLSNNNCEPRTANRELPSSSSISAFQHFSISAFKKRGCKVILYLGRIHPKKGLINLLRAWSKLQVSELNPHPSKELVLVIAGWDQGGHEAELKHLATELCIRWADIRMGMNAAAEQTASTSNFSFQLSTFQNSTLVFTGPLFGADKDDAYRACDAFILPSFSEGLPMAVLEAWAYGKPVLMTPECNLPEGFAADAAIRIETNAESIQNGLEQLFRIPHSALRTLGANGRTLVEQRFTWPKIAAEMKSVYDWVLGGGSPPTCVRLD